MRRPAQRPRLHRVLKGVRSRIRTRRSNRVAATDSQSRMADFASAFLARDQSTATDFELRLVGRVAPCAPGPSACRGLPALPGNYCALKADPHSEIAARLDRAP